MQSTIAIVEPQWLVAVGLQQCLQAMLPSAEVIVYDDVEQCVREIKRTDGQRPFFVHFFVDAQLLQQYRDFFLAQPQITIALTKNEIQVSGFYSLDISAPKKQLLSELQNLHADPHRHTVGSLLSKREVEVLKCVAQGMLNKQIADSLCMSINTVITHRQHIAQKTNLRSAAQLTMFAALNGYL